MKKCNLCGKEGPFLKLNNDGYCPECAELVRREAEQKQLEEERAAAKWDEIIRIPEYKITLSDIPRKRRSGYYTMNIHFSNITPRGSYNNVVVFDTETTGLVPYSDRIIQIAAVKFIKGRPVERFHSYVKPHHKISEGAHAVNGITDDMLVNAPTIDRLLPDFEDFVGTATLVAHNLNFDLHFLYYSGSIVMGEKRRYIDTLAQARKHLKKSADVANYKLGTLCEYYGITIAQQHNALADAYAAGELFFKLVNDITEGRCSLDTSRSEPGEDAAAEYILEPEPEFDPVPEPVSESVSKSKPQPIKQKAHLGWIYKISRVIACLCAAFFLLGAGALFSSGEIVGGFVFLVPMVLFLLWMKSCTRHIKLLNTISAEESQAIK